MADNKAGKKMGSKIKLVMESYIPQEPAFFECSRTEWKNKTEASLKQSRSFLRKNLGVSVNKKDEVYARRRKALLNCYDEFCERYSGYLHGVYSDFSPAVRFIAVNACTLELNILDDHGVTYAAALWALDHMDLHDEDVLEKLVDLLPDYEELKDYKVEEDLDLKHHNDLVLAMGSVLSNTFVTDEEVEEDYLQKKALLFNAVSATKPGDPDSPFGRLLQLLPDTAVREAEKHFMDLFWKWSDFIVEGIPGEFERAKYLNKRKVELIQRLRFYEADLKKLMETVESQRESLMSGLTTAGKAFSGFPVELQSGMKPTISALGVKPTTAGDRVPAGFVLPDKSREQFNAKTREFESTAAELLTVNSELRELFERENKFADTCVGFVLPRPQNLSKYIDSDLVKKMQIPAADNPFEICFALFSLLYRGSDYPWLYGILKNTILSACEATPWGLTKPEPDAVLAQSDQAESREHDWYKRLYHLEGNEDDLPRSVAQIVYENTGCILPRFQVPPEAEQSTVELYDLPDDTKEMVRGFVALLNAAKEKSATNPYMRKLVEGAEAGDEAGQETDEEEDPEFLASHYNQLKKELKHTRILAYDSDYQNRLLRADNEKKDRSISLLNQELADLRSIVFALQNKREPEINLEDNFEFPLQVPGRIIVFGGFENWLKEIRQLVEGTLRFVPKDSDFDPSLVKNADAVWFQTNCLSHAQYYKASGIAKSYKIPIRYFLFESAKKCAIQLANNLNPGSSAQ